MAAKAMTDYYWYSCQLEKVRSSSITTRFKSGTLDAFGALDALDALHDLYKNTEWTIANARICTVDKDGEVVATIESGPRDTSELQTSGKKEREALLYEYATPFRVDIYPTAFRD